MASEILGTAYANAPPGAPLYVDGDTQLRAADVAAVAEVRPLVFDPDADGADQPGVRVGEWPEPPAAPSVPLNINLGELGDGTTALTTSEREFIVYFEEEGTVTGWTCGGDAGAVTLDVETAPVVSGVDSVWTTRLTSGSDQRPSFSGTAPTSITLTGANQFTLAGRTAVRLTVAVASGGATVVRLAFHGTRS